MEKSIHTRREKLIYSMLVLLLLGATPAYGAGGGGNSAIDGKPNYYTLDPAFVVNVQGNSGLRFMQLNVDLMTQDTNVIKALDKYRIPIRHELIMLFAHLHMNEVTGTKAREELRKQALHTIQDVLNQHASLPLPSEKSKTIHNVEALYFTNFIIQ